MPEYDSDILCLDKFLFFIYLDQLGEVVLQDTFQVFEAKSLTRKGRERHIFLFELYLSFSKEVKDSNGKAKYSYKQKLLTSEIGITEHVERSASLLFGLAKLLFLSTRLY